MVLLHVLHRLAAANEWKLVVAHFNHQLRGVESEADEQLVRETAKRLGLRFIGGRGDVQSHQAAGKSSLEMAARELRHIFLGRTAARRQIPAVALAHHADDQVELFFLRLFRGAGGEGLSGMKWISPAPFHPQLRLVRPLLDQPKAALLAFARAEKIAFREDASNDSSHFLRNRIRHELLPLLTEQYDSSVPKTVLRAMEIIGAEAECAERVARRWLDHRPRDLFHHQATAIQRQIVRLQLLRLGLVPAFDRVEHLRLNPNQPITVEEGWTLCRDEIGMVSRRKIVRAKFNQNEISLDLKGPPSKQVFDEVEVRWEIEPNVLTGGRRADILVRSDSPAQERLRSSTEPDPSVIAADKNVRAPLGCEYFDAAKVGLRITLRHWRNGDRFQPIGMPQEVKLQDWFTNLKIPRARRLELIVAATETGQVFWIEGLRIGERFKLDKETRRRLKWQWQRLNPMPVASSKLP